MRNHINLVSIQSLYSHAEGICQIVAEVSGDIWVETTDRESIRILDLFPEQEIETSPFFFNQYLEGFWNQSKIKHKNFVKLTKETENVIPLLQSSKSFYVTPIIGALFSFLLFSFQKNTNTQNHYMVDTFRTNGLYPSRIAQLRGLLQGSLWTFCDYEKDQLFADTTCYYSLSGIFNSSLWLEREMAEMHNLQFLYHPDLRYLLLDYGMQNLYDRQGKEF